MLRTQELLKRHRIALVKQVLHVVSEQIRRNTQTKWVRAQVGNPVIAEDRASRGPAGAHLLPPVKPQQLVALPQWRGDSPAQGAAQRYDLALRRTQGRAKAGTLFLELICSLP
jgi:hypothetical protein